MTVNLEPNEEGLMAVENELQQAAADKQLLARWMKLEKLRITPEMEILDAELEGFLAASTYEDPGSNQDGDARRYGFDDFDDFDEEEF